MDFTENQAKIASIHISPIRGFTIIQESPASVSSSVEIKDKNWIDPYKLAQEMIPGGVMYINFEEGHPIFDSNQQFLDLLGYDNYSQLKKKTGALLLNLIHPDDLKATTEILRTAIKQNEDYSAIYRVKHKSGEYIWTYDRGRKITYRGSFETMIAIMYDITDDIKSQTQLRYYASFDSLTGIYNRRVAQEKIMERLTEEISQVLVIIDVDNFKEINDSYGHQEGDLALKKLANIIESATEKFNTVITRFGGDEFIIEWRKEHTIESIIDCANDINIKFIDYTTQQYANTNISLSIGASHIKKSDTFNTLYSNADHALYQAKQIKNRITFK